MITSVGAQPSATGPDDWFTGAVRIDPLFNANGWRRGAASVTFEPDEKHWHGATATNDLAHIAIQET